MLSTGSMITACPAQISSDLDHEVIILNLESGTYYGLSEVGAAVWKLIQQPMLVGELREWLQMNYDIDHVSCEDELLNLLQELYSEGLIQIQSIEQHEISSEET